MSSVLRHALGAAGAIVVLLGSVGGVARAASPEGPRLAFVELKGSTRSIALASTDPAGSEPYVYFRAFRRTRPAPLLFEGPAWFPDGSSIAFAGLVGTRGGDSSIKTKIFVIGSDGGAPWPVAGTEEGLAPVVSPDGRSIAFAMTRERVRVVRRSGEAIERAERAVSTWVVDVESGALRQLTPWTYGVERIPTSFSPDGQAVAVTQTRLGRLSRRLGMPSVLAVRLDGSGSTVLLRKAAAAEFSPDGSQIAYLRLGRRYGERDKTGVTRARYVDLFVANTDGTGSTRLTETPKRLELYPSWDPAGQRLAFLQLGTASEFFETLGAGDAIVQINADGTCPTKVLSRAGTTLFGPAWQPGVGREAGRIIC